MSAWSITIRPPAEQAEFDRLRGVLTEVLGLDWRGMSGEPDGDEIAADCAEALWAAGFRVQPAPPTPPQPSGAAASETEPQEVPA